MRLWLVVVGLSFAAGCSDGDSNTDGGGQDAAIARDAGLRDAGRRDAQVLESDGGRLVVHDAGGPVRCQTTCNCPQGKGCFDDVCQNVGRPIYCCDKAGCPGGEMCLDTLERPDVCEGGPGLPDGGTCRRDAGTRDPTPQALGGDCAEDSHCAPGLTCLTRDEPGAFWGYCTVESCEITGCPAGSTCFELDASPRATACLKQCDDEDDCRIDAHCLEIPALPKSNGVCIPDCRDDLLDCAPRNGTSYCNPMSGQCEATPSQWSTPKLGGRCHNNVDCGTGEVCMGEIGWGYPCGMCGQVCAGLPEAVPCPGGSTCQVNGTIGVCFRDCTDEGTCPQRSDAVCGLLDGWISPSCVPQP